MNRFLNRNFGLLIYLLYVACELFLLWQGRTSGLFPMPSRGTDQLSMLEGAAKLANGVLPGGDYRYSYAYTAWLAILTFITGGSLVAMRVLQALLCGLIPVFIYNSARMLRVGRPFAQFAALLYVFYAPALLISIDFLRASPLALAFIFMYYAFLRGLHGRSAWWFAAAGLSAAVCVLGRENFAAVIIVPALFWLVPKMRRRAGLSALYIYLAAAFLPVLAVMLFNYAAYSSFQPVPGNASNIMNFYHGKAASENILTAAGSLAKSIPVQFGAFLSSYEHANSLSVYAHKEILPFLRVFALPFNLLALLAFIGAFHFRKNSAAMLAFLLVCAYAGSMLFFTMFYRFRIPALPLIAILAGAGIAALADNVRQHRWKTLCAICAAGTVFLFPTWVEPDSKRQFSERSAVARGLVELKRFDEAENYYAKLAAEGHDIRPGAALLIQRVFESGDQARAGMLAKRFFRPEGNQR